MNFNSKIYIAGHGGMVGSSILRELKLSGYNNLVFKTHNELDLGKQELVNRFFEKEKPEYVFLAAALVGGIEVNRTKPSEFLYENLMIELNVINAAWKYVCKKLLFLGSSCIYPKDINQPMREINLLDGAPELTNEAYALAKISGIKYCEYLHKQYGFNAISLMPTNIYGINDDYDLNSSHVIPALINKFHNAKINNQNEVICWGDGSPFREFLYVDDLANACVYMMNNYDGVEFINIGTGKEISIKQLTEVVAQVVGYSGTIKWDINKPNGSKRKLLDISKAKNLGWEYKTELEVGIKLTYQDFLNRYK